MREDLKILQEEKKQFLHVQSRLENVGSCVESRILMKKCQNDASVPPACKSSLNHMHKNNEMTGNTVRLLFHPGAACNSQDGL